MGRLKVCQFDQISGIFRNEFGSFSNARNRALAQKKVRAREQGTSEGQSLVALEVADDRLLARVERVVPGRRRVAERIPFRRFEPHDARAEPEKLAARVRTGEVPREVDDEQTCEWRHDGSNVYK